MPTANEPNEELRKKYEAFTDGKHRWDWCGLCQTFMVVCGTCGNNCCNGGFGFDGTCKDCSSAYDLQHKGWDD